MTLTHFVRALALSLAFASVSVAAKAEPREYRVDPEHFHIVFSADHLGFGDVIGMFLSGQASFVYDEETNRLISASATIDADSVFTNVDARDRHLRSGDFLDAGNHPAIQFVARSATALGENRGRVTGDLTIRGVTRSIPLDVELTGAGDYPFPTTGPEPNNVLGVRLTTSFLRSDFGMSYAVENGWVGDEVDVIIAFEAIRQ
ncbi:MAG: YceI family protein [Pseudomonadota bacterium]